MKQLAILAFLMLSTIAYSQSFISEDKVWLVNEGSAFPHLPVFGVIYVIDGTKEHNGMTYHRLLRGNHLDSLSEYGGIRETADNKVFMHLGASEHLLCDFGAVVGDTIHFTIELAVVAEIDTITLENGEQSRRWHLQGEQAWQTGTWIEGVGSQNKPFFPAGPFVGLDAINELRCCNKNNQAYYFDPNTSSNPCIDLNINTSTQKIKKEFQLYCADNNILLKGLPELDVRIQLYNAQGLLVQSSKFENGYVELDASVFSGIYFYTLSNQKGIVSSGRIYIP